MLIIVTNCPAWKLQVSLLGLQVVRNSPARSKSTKTVFLASRPCLTVLARRQLNSKSRKKA